MSAHESNPAQFIPGKLYEWSRISSGLFGTFDIRNARYSWAHETVVVDQIVEREGFVLLEAYSDEQINSIMDLKVLTANGIVGWLRINLSSYSIKLVEG